MTPTKIPGKIWSVSVYTAHANVNNKQFYVRTIWTTFRQLSSPDIMGELKAPADDGRFIEQPTGSHFTTTRTHIATLMFCFISVVHS